MAKSFKRHSLFHVANSEADLYYDSCNDKLVLVYREEDTPDATWIQVPNQDTFVAWIWNEFEKALNDTEKIAKENFFKSNGDLSYLRENGLIAKFTIMATEEAKKVIEAGGFPLNSHSIPDVWRGLI